MTIDMKTSIYYGSTTGTTETVAGVIAEKLGLSADAVHEVSELDEAAIAENDVLVLGTSTWGEGELQDDWYSGIEILKGADLNGKKIALFGCGDSQSYCDTFCDGMGHIYEALEDKGCTFIGATSTDGYSFSESHAVIDGKFVGLAIDDMNESDMTENRISAWAEAIKPELA